MAHQAAHLHNTRGQGLANVVALDVDVSTFDSSLGTLGGCPFAPGATDPIVTEDLIFMLEAMGLCTGVDVDALIAARKVSLRGLPGKVLYGNVPEVSLPRGFSYAGGRVLYEQCTGYLRLSFMLTSSANTFAIVFNN